MKVGAVQLDRHLQEIGQCGHIGPLSFVLRSWSVLWSLVVLGPWSLVSGLRSLAHQGLRTKDYFTVSRTTSSTVVTPIFTFRKPLWRSVIIPSSTALRRSSRPDAPTRISSRSSSAISITSYKPTRPL